MYWGQHVIIFKSCQWQENYVRWQWLSRWRRKYNETPVKYGIKASLRRWHMMSNSNSCHHMVPAEGWKGNSFPIHGVAPQFNFHCVPPETQFDFSRKINGRWHMTSATAEGWRLKKQQFRNQLKFSKFSVQCCTLWFDQTSSYCRQKCRLFYIGRLFISICDRICNA